MEEEQQDLLFIRLQKGPSPFFQNQLNLSKHILVCLPTPRSSDPPPPFLVLRPGSRCYDIPGAYHAVPVYGCRQRARASASPPVAATTPVGPRKRRLSSCLDAITAVPPKTQAQQQQQQQQQQAVQHQQPDLVAAAMLVPAAGAQGQGQTSVFTKIFVGGLPYHTSDKSLREHFEAFGEIEEAVVITDRQNGKSRGYGFLSLQEQGYYLKTFISCGRCCILSHSFQPQVTMVDVVGAERACKDPNPIIDGRKANVNLAFLGAKPRGNSIYNGYFPAAPFANVAAALRPPIHFFNPAALCHQWCLLCKKGL
ncbi:unnamed protein product [Notodromas monacha]|uniref:RRM domain-containing protein n=1 Tax=Notodromas monacha TaxID=399045 RepID=A0A7R9G963_9CRUS|nr:unnamed protein product [Notodromas monacha]CAG0912514.1 unnamed protein product [Notodromas monacha]